MKLNKFFFAVAVIAACGLFSCGSDKSSGKDQEANEENSSTSSDENNNESANGQSSTSDATTGGPVVDFRVLKDALPETLAGLKRTSHTGQKTSMASFNISNAQAEYSEGDKSISATITDTGGMGMAMAGLAAWTSLEMDSETDDGYEKTTMIDGRKAWERYSKSSNSGELSIIEDNRFIITLHSTNVTMEELRDAAKKIDVKA